MTKDKYKHQSIEGKWREEWERRGVYKTQAGEKNTYVLGMFPYPSGAGLHTGHVRIYTATDVLARFLRMQGRDVLYPVGWDAFGLPAENRAVKEGRNPKEMVPKFEENFKRQMKMMGFSYDWERTFSTTDPKYYKWTQWLFLQLYGVKNERGERLVYRDNVDINWCPECKTGIANEAVLSDGTHERCGSKVEQKQMDQWVMRITDWADELLEGLDEEWEDVEGESHQGLDWPKGIVEMQKNWIGRKEGVRVKFDVKGKDLSLEIFTTRLDTIWGATFMAVSPEKVKQWADQGLQIREEVAEYVRESLRKTDQERLAQAGEKSGVKLKEIKAVNPVNKEELPIFVADYVLAAVGTGAVMGVPAHDERDFQFAEKYDLPKKVVIEPQRGKAKEGEAFEEDGVLVNSDKYDGLDSGKGREKIWEELKKKGLAEREVTYHLRDWVFSRQRYWGEPFPLVYCDKCGDENGVVPLGEEDLPLELPDLGDFEPTDTGESPLSKVDDWVETKCPKCGGEARRETDTMPNWAGSCWYFLRFTLLFDGGLDEGELMGEVWEEEFKKGFEKWLPVDWYLGGAEHAVLHLLYARFWIKVFRKLGLVEFEEPFLRLRSVGMVLAKDGKKMSKSLGNVVNPDEVVDEYGADAVRVYEMFMGPWDQAIAWDSRALVGCRRFLDKAWRLANEAIENNLKKSDGELVVELNKVIKAVAEDIEDIKFNTAVAALMEFCNGWQKSKQGLSIEDLKKFLKVLTPLAPFLSEELYQRAGGEGLICEQSWPRYEEKLLEEREVEIPIQVNGKLREVIKMEKSQAEDEERVVEKALKQEQIQKYVEGKERKVVFVPGRLVNFVVGE